MSIFSRFFQFLSKTDRRLIEYCTDHSVKTQVSNGVFVLLTAMFAFLSGMYAVYTTFRDFRVAIPVGLLYATVIAFIDREIVSTSNRGATLARLPLAFAIGLVVSVPLEMKLFENRIKDQMDSQDHDKNRTALTQKQNDEQAFRNRITTLEEEIRTYRQNITEAGLDMQGEITGEVRAGRSGTGIPGEGRAFRAAKAQLDRNRELLVAAQAELQRLNQSESTVVGRIDENFKGNVVPPRDDFLVRYEALEAVKASSPSAIYLTMGIRLLIILLEMSPALMKLLQRDNEYSVALEGNRRVNISRIIGLANDQIDQIVRDPKTAPKPTLLEHLRENPFAS
jgi:Domain of unknown function (DUF4407)